MTGSYKLGSLIYPALIVYIVAAQMKHAFIITKLITLTTTAILILVILLSISDYLILANNSWLVYSFNFSFNSMYRYKSDKVRKTSRNVIVVAAPRVYRKCWPSDVIIL